MCVDVCVCVHGIVFWDEFVLEYICVNVFQRECESVCVSLCVSVSVCVRELLLLYFSVCNVLLFPLNLLICECLCLSVFGVNACVWVSAGVFVCVCVFM